MKTIFILFCSVISCLGQAFTWHDLALVESQNAGAAFQPSDVAGLVMWYDASSITSPTNVNGYLVTNWWDKSVNAYMAYNAASGGQPYWTNNVSRLGGKPWLEFTNNRLLHATTQLYVQPNTIFVLCTWRTTSSARAVHDGTNTLYRHVLYNSSRAFRINAGTEVTSAANAFSANVWYLCEETYTNGTSLLYTNGVSVMSGDAGVKSLSGFSIGSFYDGSSPYDGGIAEILVYNSNVSAGDRTNIRNYFTTKYGAYASW